MNADSIADLLAEHGGLHQVMRLWRCRCGERVSEPSNESTHRTEWMRAHVAQVLVAAFEEALDAKASDDNLASRLSETELADAWDAGHGDGCIAAHCYLNRGEMWFDESKLTDCHTRNPYRETSE